jgi:hypothetical protein
MEEEGPQSGCPIFGLLLNYVNAKVKKQKLWVQPLINQKN